MHKITLTNGSANLAYGCLQQGLKTIDDIFIGGSVAVKLKGAKTPPKREKDETDRDYSDRIDKWSDEPFGEVELEEDQRDTLKKAVRSMAEEKKLYMTDSSVSLISQLGLNKNNAS